MTAPQSLRPAALLAALLLLAACKGDDEKAYASGCSGYITKPLDTRTFADTVAGHLPAPRAEGAA